MIESKDLRIGNNLLWGSTIVEVSSIHADNTIRFWDANKINTVGCFKINAFNPIHLTEEILLKCGEKYNNSGFDLGKFKILKSTSGVFLVPTNNKLIVIDFLHDLQNFYYYYENSKTELPFKP